MSQFTSTNEPEYPITIPVDVILHTPEHPFCSDMSCPCHSDQEAINRLAQCVTDGLISDIDAIRIFRGLMV